MKNRPLLLVSLSVFLTVGCNGGGFSLPRGDIERGRAAYVQLQCNACHQVAGIPQHTVDGQAEIAVALGGEVTRIKTYGELVTSIINPSHRIARGYAPDSVQVDGESKMKNYNDVMTVSQLIDLVAFLQSQYTLLEYEPTYYPVY